MKELDELRRFLKASGFTVNAAVKPEWWEHGKGMEARVTISGDSICLFRFEDNQRLRYSIMDLDPNSVPIELIKSIIRKALIA